MKKQIGIEKLLTWTYRDELPKEQTSIGSFLRPEGFSQPWGAVTKTGILGQSVDEPDVRNRFGLVPDFTSQTEPHPDALDVWSAVQALDTSHIVRIPDDWNPIAEFGDLGPLGRAAVVRGIRKATVTDAKGNQHLRRQLSEFVQHFVIMGGAPQWTFPKPELKLVSNRYGTPKCFIREVINVDGQNIEVETENGFDKKKQGRKPGAYTKPFLDPDPISAVIARVEYVVWYDVLGWLVDHLSGRLLDHEPVSSQMPGEPWSTGRQPPLRILIDRQTPQPRLFHRVGRVPLAPRREPVTPVRNVINSEDRERGYVLVDGQKLPIARRAR